MHLKQANLPIPESGSFRRRREAFLGNASQFVALLFCVLFGLVLIVNNQLGGEATWFWYARLFHGGSKLYADLHLVLQPLYVLELDVWINLFGKHVIITEIPSALHLLALCLGMVILLSHSDWPDWEKALILCGVFIFWISAISYRFDDFHATLESFAIFSLSLLLWLAKCERIGEQISGSLALGLLSGLAITSRLNDGAALFGSTLICIFALARSNRLLLVALFTFSAALSVVLIVRSTGDTFSDYILYTVVKAAGDKGGAKSLLAAPFVIVPASLKMLQDGKWITGAGLLVVVVGAVTSALAKTKIRAIVSIQLAAALVIFLVSPLQRKAELLGESLATAIPFAVLIIYSSGGIVLVRYLASKLGRKSRSSSARELLVLIPLAELMSLSTSAAAKLDIHHYCWQMALFLLLVPVLVPFGRQATWVNASFVTILALLGLCGAVTKSILPYGWDDQGGSPIFVNRQWYSHPTLGLMYTDKVQLELYQSICADIGTGNTRRQLLSIPFSYPNYFCDIPPWNGYVETFFDISAHSSVTAMVDELRASPPQWIVYHRQLGNLAAHERAYNHGKRLPQRDLDELISQRVAAGRWRVVDWKPSQAGEGWYIIRTQP